MLFIAAERIYLGKGKGERFRSGERERDRGGLPVASGMSWKREQELERVGIDEPEVSPTKPMADDTIRRKPLTKAVGESR